MAPSIDVRALVRAAKTRESEVTSTSERHDRFFPDGFVDTTLDDDGCGVASEKSIPIATVDGLSYEREWLGERDADELERALLASPSSWWTSWSNARRVMNAGGNAPSQLFRGEEDLKHFPAYLRALMRAMVNRKTSDAEPNHVLVNEYESRGGITPHSDGAVYAEDVSILTLRGTALIEFWPSEGEITGRPIASVLLEPRSVLTYKGAAYRLRHGIRETDADVVTEETANARALGLNPGARVERNPRGRVSVVFVRKRTVV